MEPRRLLIVDDEVALLVTLKGFFERRGYRVWAVNSGEAALQAAHHHRPHVVLLDVHLGGSRLQGFDVLRRIKTQWPDFIVLMWSSAVDADRQAKAFELGADRFFEKPLNLAQLLSTVQEATERSPLEPPP